MDAASDELIRTRVLKDVHDYAAEFAYKDDRNWRNVEDIKKALDDVESVAVSRAVGYLTQLGFIKDRGSTCVGITPKGIKLFEEVNAKPDEKFEHLASMKQVVNIYGNVTNSAIQQGGHGAQQAATVTVEHSQELSGHLTGLLKEIMASKLAEQNKNDAAANVRSMLAQLEAAEPDKSILKALWSKVKDVLDKVTTTVLSAEALKIIAAIGAILLL